MVKYIALAIAFIATSVIILFNPFNFSRETKDAILPFATLALAFAAFLTILYSQNQERRRTRESKLDEIIDWASEGRRIFSRYLSWQTPSERNETRIELGWITAKKLSMLESAKQFGNKLLPVVKITASYLDSYIEWLEEPPKKPPICRVNKNIDSPEKFREKCGECFCNVIEAASNLKAELSS